MGRLICIVVPIQKKTILMPHLLWSLFVFFFCVSQVMQLIDACEAGDADLEKLTSQRDDALRRAKAAASSVLSSPSSSNFATPTSSQPASPKSATSKSSTILLTLQQKSPPPPPPPLPPAVAAAIAAAAAMTESNGEAQQQQQQQQHSGGTWESERSELISCVGDLRRQQLVALEQHEEWVQVLQAAHEQVCKNEEVKEGFIMKGAS
jgi:hypothetical protein